MTQAVFSQPIQVGEVVADKYRVDRVLGEGGMGIVVAATHLHLDQRVALKFLLPSMVSSPELVQRFLREARAAVKIHSEHVARVLDVGTHQGSPYMVMEYLEGGDLAQVLAARGPLPITEAVGYLLEACEAVAEAHSLGIVHRDLKPSNLFLANRPAGRPAVKVLDFGISKAPSTDNDANLTRPTAVMGSPSYMSPEQLVSAASVDMRSDVWALGIVLYEMVTRTLPFTAHTMPELVGAILQTAPPPIASSRDGVPAELQIIVDRCLQKNPSDRFGNVAELARALLAFGPSRSEQSVERIEHVLGLAGAAGAEGYAPPRRSDGAPRRGDASGSTFSPATTHARRPSGKWLLWSGLAAVVVIGVAAAAAGMILRHSVTAPAPSSIIGSASPAIAASFPAATTLAPLASAAPPRGGGVRQNEIDALPSAAPESNAPSPSTHSGPQPQAISPAPAGNRRAAGSGASAAAPAAPLPAPAASAAQPSCHTVSYFDTDGNKHFKQECR